jgi:hypothetical protein
MTQMDDGTGEIPHPHAQTPVDADVPTGPEDVLPARPPGRRAKPVEHTPSPLGRIVLPVVLLLLAAVALFGAWNQLGADEDADVAGPAPSSSASASVAPSPSASPSTTASAKPSPTPTKTSASPTKSPSPTASVVIDRSVPVTVLNGTRRTGLAAKVANELRAKGWTVVSIGNWRGSGVDTTTVFVVAREDAAATMRRDLKAADATEEPIGAMRTNRITVVIMDDYPQR